MTYVDWSALMICAPDLHLGPRSFDRSLRSGPRDLCGQVWPISAMARSGVRSMSRRAVSQCGACGVRRAFFR